MATTPEVGPFVILLIVFSEIFSDLPPRELSEPSPVRFVPGGGDTEPRDDYGAVGGSVGACSPLSSVVLGWDREVIGRLWEVYGI